MNNYNELLEERSSSIGAFNMVLEKDRLMVLGEEHSTWMLVARCDFWLYYFAYFCGGTIGLVYSNNLGQVCQSLGYGLETEELVAIYSTCSFFGRLISAVPDLSSCFYTPQMNTSKYKVWKSSYAITIDLMIQTTEPSLNYAERYTTRTGWLALSLMPMPLGFLVLVLSDTKASLRAATGLIGISSGFIFSAAVSITSELFGSKSSGINHNILITNIPLGSLLYGVLGGVIYDNNIKSSNETVFVGGSRLSRFKERGKVAFKRLDRRHGQGESEFLREITMLSFYRHSNLISLLGFSSEGEEMILAYEHASNGSLDCHLESPSLTRTRRLKICLQAAEGLRYLHDPNGTHQRVIHHDIKSANILLDKEWNAKVSDFGLSKLGPANEQRSYVVTNATGTLGYCDPMYLQTYTLTKESDVYSFGVVLFEVLCGKLCYKHSNGQLQVFVSKWKEQHKQHKLEEIIFHDLKQQMDATSSEIFTDIAYQCLRKSRKQRPTMSRVVEKLDIALQVQEATPVSSYSREYDYEEKLQMSLNEMPQAKYPAFSFEKQLTDLLMKIYGMILDNLKKELSPFIGLCILAPKTSRETLVKGRPHANVVAQQTSIAHLQCIVNDIENYFETMKANFMSLSLHFWCGKYSHRYSRSSTFGYLTGKDVKTLEVGEWAG
ncbi:kinase-like domain, phloem protein 2-like protein [Tanacetum coccineum]